MQQNGYYIVTRKQKTGHFIHNNIIQKYMYTIILFSDHAHRKVFSIFEIYVV